MTDTTDPALTAETKELIDDLRLLPKHFVETGVIERLVALLTEKDLALTAARVNGVVKTEPPTLTLDRLNGLLYQYDNSPGFGVREVHAALIAPAPAAEGGPAAEQTDAHQVVQTIIEGSHTAQLLDGTVATLIVEVLGFRTNVEAPVIAGAADQVTDRFALIEELGAHQAKFLMVEPLTPGMGRKDTGGLECSCGQWSAPVMGSGLRPWDPFLGHHADAILALGFDRKARAAAAAAWRDGVATALNNAIRNPDGITLRLEHLDGRPWANPNEDQPSSATP